MTDHLVILQSPWLERIVDGRKSVEFRASDRRIAPHGRVSRGDRLWMKASGGPLMATALVSRAESRGPFQEPELAEFLEHIHGDPADALDTSWRERLLTQQHVTLIWTRAVRRIPDVDVRDLRGRRQDSWQFLTDEQVHGIRSRLPRGWAEALS